LLARVAQSLPSADLVPVLNPDLARVGRLLATLPVQLKVPPVELEVNPASPLRISLVIAWLFLTLATSAVAILLRGVVALSERRAAFVSAVTHELRTPLTTFRMYAEMLAEGMVTEPQQRQRYLQTLQVEADRLAHLVENVLQYSRLERGPAPSGGRRSAWRHCWTPGTAVGRPRRASGHAVGDRRRRRLTRTAAHDRSRAVEQIVMNLVDNACKYAGSAADRRIHLRAEHSARAILLRVSDHGPGISPGEAKRLFRPFSKSAQQAAASAPGVGLGLALCRRLAAELGGRLEFHRAAAIGAEFILTLPR